MKDFRQGDIQKYLYFRAAAISAIRRFFYDKGYLEVETPIRIPAPAPEIHIDAVSSGNWYLQTSPELCMKRLLAAGYDKIFQICKCFRDNEKGAIHLPEFTLLEWYSAGVDYRYMMDETEELIRYVSEKTGVGDALDFRGEKIHLTKPWTRLNVVDAFNKYASVSLEKSMADDIFEEILTEEIEPFLGKNRPLFLTDYPEKMAALARLKKDDPRYAERFELYIGGIEICNAFSELTDEKEQRERFKKDNFVREAMGKKAYPESAPFLASLPYMPDASGNALGVDRLVMVLSGLTDIDQVTSFMPNEL